MSSDRLPCRTVMFVSKFVPDMFLNKPQFRQSARLAVFGHLFSEAVALIVVFHQNPDKSKFAKIHNRFSTDTRLIGFGCNF